MNAAPVAERPTATVAAACGDLAAVVRRGPQRHEETTETTYSAHVEDTLRSALGVHERLAVRAVLTRRRHGLVLAQRGQVASAEVVVEQANRLLDSYPLPESAAMLVAADLTAVTAYVAHRRGRAAEARALVHQVLMLDRRLVDLHDLGFVELHRVQQLHNLTRIADRLGDRTTATRLLAGALGYVVGRPEAWPLADEPARPEAFARLPLAWRAAMAAQLVSELAIWQPRLAANELAANGLAACCRQAVEQAGEDLRRLGPQGSAAAAWLVARIRAEGDGDPTDFAHDRAFDLGEQRYQAALATQLEDLVAVPHLWWATALSATNRLRHGGAASVALAALIVAEAGRKATGLRTLLAAYGVPIHGCADSAPDPSRSEQAWCRP